jgi:hypothetical protein
LSKNDEDGTILCDRYDEKFSDRLKKALELEYRTTFDEKENHVGVRHIHWPLAMMPTFISKINLLVFDEVFLIVRH